MEAIITPFLDRNISMLRILFHFLVIVMSASNISFVELHLFPFDGFLGDVRREFVQRLSTALVVLWVLVFATL
jgi:hypothetical protein